MHKIISGSFVSRFLKLIDGLSSRKRSYLAIALFLFLAQFLIESPDVPTVGVGESTIGQINQWLNLLDIKDAVTKCKELINKINKINISITNNPYYKIPLPDPHFIMKNNLETNTHIIFMNTSISLTLPPDLELNNIIDIVKCFYSYVSIIDEKQNL